MVKTYKWLLCPARKKIEWGPKIVRPRVDRYWEIIQHPVQDNPIDRIGFAVRLTGSDIFYREEQRNLDYVDFFNNYKHK